MIRHPFSKDAGEGECYCGASEDAEIHNIQGAEARETGEPEDDDFPRTFGALQRSTPKDT